MSHSFAFGGQFVPEELKAPLQELTEQYAAIRQTAAFQHELDSLFRNYAGRPTPLTEVKRFSEAIQGPRIFLKREDLLHTGAHKLNNVLGQGLLARHMGKKRMIAETGAGQHGVAVATAAARLGMECAIYMGEKDIARQRINVERMRILGATIVPVTQGNGKLNDAVDAAMADFISSYETTHFCIGSAVGPAPYPAIVRDFQSVISLELSQQIQEQAQRDPDILIACVGGGSNAIGFFHHFIDKKNVQLIGVEGGGTGLEDGHHAARFAKGRVGIHQGFASYLLQDEEGNVLSTHSISAGLDYPSVGPDHAIMHESGRASYTYALDEEALAAFYLLSKTEGIIPALESSHALAHAMKIAPTLDKDVIVCVNLSGRGDKDIKQVLERQR